MERSRGEATVLVVDDEEGVADIYAEHLTERYTVRTAYSGDGAIESMSPDIDVVLLDRRMPDRSGGEVIDRIRGRGYNCRVVFITAVEPDLDVLSLGFDEYLVKPVLARELYDVVDAMLARNEYVATVREAISLASRIATLESKMDVEELEESDRYTDAQERFHELREDVETPPSEGIYSELTREKLELLFE